LHLARAFRFFVLSSIPLFSPPKEKHSFLPPLVRLLREVVPSSSGACGSQGCGLPETPLSRFSCHRPINFDRLANRWCDSESPKCFFWTCDQATAWRTSGLAASGVHTRNGAAGWTRSKAEEQPSRALIALAEPSRAPCVIPGWIRWTLDIERWWNHAGLFGLRWLRRTTKAAMS